MTRETKADLRRRIKVLEERGRSRARGYLAIGDALAAQRTRAQNAERKARAFEGALDRAGLAYSIVGTWDQMSVNVRITGVNNVVKSAIRDTATHEALSLVIEALDLKEYQGYQEFPGALHTARFEKDLRTALDVRAERKAQAKRDATEEKVAGLTKPAPGLGNVPVYAVALSAEDRDLIRRLQDANERDTVLSKPRPDKTVDETLDDAERED